MDSLLGKNLSILGRCKGRTHLTQRFPATLPWLSQPPVSSQVWGQPLHGGLCCGFDIPRHELEHKLLTVTFVPCVMVTCSSESGLG